MEDSARNNTLPEAEIAQLIDQLHEPWSRRAARRKLIAARAIGPLMKCLTSRNESVVWAAIQAIGELRAAEAVGPLIELLDAGTLTLDVTETLRAITGHDFETDAACWRRWSAAQGGAEPAPFDVAQCVRHTADFLGAKASGSGNAYRFKLSLPNGRTQKVVVRFGRENSARKNDAASELVVIYSECGPAKSKYYETVLRKNLTIPSGAFAVRDIDGEPHFVMVDTMYAASVTAGTLAKKIEDIAIKADAVEKSLTKEDRR